MEVKRTYYDFAAHDAKFFIEDVENDRVANYMAAMAQNICERFLKHVIDEYYEPESEIEDNNKLAILRTYSIRKLTEFISTEMGIEIEDSKRDNIEKADGYYFTTRYPGEDSFFVTNRDIYKCKESVIDCKAFVDGIILEHQKIQEQKEQENHSLLNEVLAGEHTPNFATENNKEPEFEIK